MRREGSAVVVAPCTSCTTRSITLDPTSVSRNLSRIARRSADNQEKSELVLHQRSDDLVKPWMIYTRTELLEQGVVEVLRTDEAVLLDVVDVPEPKRLDQQLGLGSIETLKRRENARAIWNTG